MKSTKYAWFKVYLKSVILKLSHIAIVIISLQNPTSLHHHEGAHTQLDQKLSLGIKLYANIKLYVLFVYKYVCLPGQYLSPLLLKIWQQIGTVSESGPGINSVRIDISTPKN